MLEFHLPTTHKYRRKKRFLSSVLHSPFCRSRRSYPQLPVVIQEDPSRCRACPSIPPLHSGNEVSEVSSRGERSKDGYTLKTGQPRAGPEAISLLGVL
ncbi:hypothetical protein TNIN_363631 [Trichonephila inaurata madagascariensis]|uniref:Uncharacterized protein n=1 Tax=Trichonephila inaurata madagascariensis TaxID=2747483 RepID=A0A8X6XKB8_9ARAC|nr:hypothetical protein TNIN_363631 [Trichonephila inaurata madagascariensis]